MAIVVTLQTVFVIFFIGLGEGLPLMLHSAILKPDFYLQIRYLKKSIKLIFIGSAYRLTLYWLFFRFIVNFSSFFAIFALILRNLTVFISIFSFSLQSPIHFINVFQFFAYFSPHFLFFTLEFSIKLMIIYTSAWNV